MGGGRCRWLLSFCRACHSWDAISLVLPGVAVFILRCFLHRCHITFGLLASIIVISKQILISDFGYQITFLPSGALRIGTLALPRVQTDLFHILFKNILAFSRPWYVDWSIIILVLLVKQSIFFKQLLLTSFDPFWPKLWEWRVEFSTTIADDSSWLWFLSQLCKVPERFWLWPCWLHQLRQPISMPRISRPWFVSSTLGAGASVLGLFIGYSFNVAAGSSIVLTFLLWSFGFLFITLLNSSPKEKMQSN